MAEEIAKPAGTDGGGADPSAAGPRKTTKATRTSRSAAEPTDGKVKSDAKPQRRRAASAKRGTTTKSRSARADRKPASARTSPPAAASSGVARPAKESAAKQPASARAKTRTSKSRTASRTKAATRRKAVAVGVAATVGILAAGIAATVGRKRIVKAAKDLADQGIKIAAPEATAAQAPKRGAVRRGASGGNPGRGRSNRG
jgi:hypothetical protein